jgi:TatA/E family protein of Tat protein translocase
MLRLSGARLCSVAMFQVGPLELLVVGIIALLVLGPARLPDAAKAMGRGMREFRSALDGGDDEDDRRKRSDERDLA